MKGDRQRRQISYDFVNENVRGVVYWQGKRHRVTICSFAEAGLAVEVVTDATGHTKQRAVAIPQGSPRKDAAAEKARGSLYLSRWLKLVEDVRTARPAPDASPGVLAVMADWIAAAAPDHAGGSISRMRTTVTHYEAACGDHPVTEVGPGKRDLLVAHLTGLGLAPATVNLHLRYLRAVLHWAAERDLIDKVPRVKMLRAPQRAPVVLPLTAIPQLQAHLEARIAATMHPRSRRYLELHLRFMVLIADTGARRGEIANAKLSQINLDEGYIDLTQTGLHLNKERRDKRVYLTAYSVTFFRQVVEQNPADIWVMDDGHGDLAYADAHSITTAFRRHFDDLGWSGQGIKPTHFWRALYAHRMRAQGADTRLISGQLGHSRTEVTEGYFPDDADLRQRAVRRLELASDWQAPVLPARND